MSGRFVVLVVAAIGWLFACLVVFAVVSLFGFFGVGFFGLLILFICTQVELEKRWKFGLDFSSASVGFSVFSWACLIPRDRARPH